MILQYCITVSPDCDSKHALLELALVLSQLSSSGYVTVCPKLQ